MLRTWQSQCIDKALEKYRCGGKHFLGQATPGAGKTVMAAYVGKNLIDANMIDLILCLSPSVNIAKGFTETFSRILQCTFDGKIGARGDSLTYQSIQHIDAQFWRTLSKYRVLVVFDEIHHCAGDKLAQANAWGEQIILKLQNLAQYTLALTGTPWRSDKLPITLLSYSSPEGRVLCDYQYSLKQAVLDKVCRKPKIVLVDNEKLELTIEDKNKYYTSIQALRSNEKISYSSILKNENALIHTLSLATERLDLIRQDNPHAAGLVVALSIAHARKIQKILSHTFGQSSILVSHQDPNAQSTIERFRRGKSKWIISIGMIAEGTDIPRLQVCCHLSNILTELFFRQVLGRILRITDASNQQSWLYTLAEENLVQFAQSIEDDIPDSCLYINSSQPSVGPSNEGDIEQLQTSTTCFGKQLIQDRATDSELDWDGDLNRPPKLTQISLSFGYFKEQVIEAFCSL